MTVLVAATAGLEHATRPGALPGYDDVRAAYTSSDAWLLDRHGAVLQQQRMDFGMRRLAWTTLGDVSPALRRAVIAAEDQRFFDHGGVDARAFAGALLQRARGHALRGASTISMQLAARLDAPSAGRRSPLQKLRQMRAARALEAHWSKDQILEAYLNLVDYRAEWQGIAAVAQAWFAKAPSGLTADESALLAALLPAPGADADAIGRRACTLATRLEATPDCDALRRRASALAAQPPVALAVGNDAPHLARRLLRNAGEHLVTTLDADLQRFVAATLDAQLAELRERNVRDAAAIVVDNTGGDVLAYVGAAATSRARHVDGVRARRQAGSTLKPFLYGLAIDRGYLTAASLLNDAPVNLETGAGLYIPQNYDRDFKGLVSVRAALAGSLNIPAVRTLVLVGLSPFREWLNTAGYALPESGEYYGYSLALGSAEVTLEAQANAYRALANGGTWQPLRYTATESAGARELLSPRAAFIVSDVLADAGSRALTFGFDSALATRRWSAAKTGTSKDMRDNWCIGYSRRYTVAVWVGNFEGDSMRDVSGVTGAAPAWQRIMERLDDASPAPAAPAGVVRANVVFAEGAEPPRAEWFIDGTQLARVERVPAAALRPRIDSPPAGTIVALDPDIPPGHQSIPLSARGAEQLQFSLDGIALGSAAHTLQWPPLPGRHVLALQDAAGTEVDRVEFEVRGLR